MADTLDLGSSASCVGVRVPYPAPSSTETRESRESGGDELLRKHDWCLTVNMSAFQAEVAGSIPVSCSIYAAQSTNGRSAS